MTGTNSVSFETKCYYNDWEFLVKKKLLHKMIDNCNYTFANKVLFINNFEDYTEIKNEANLLVKSNVIDEYYIVADYANEALEFFNIDIESFKGGYYYSIAEL